MKVRDHSRRLAFPFCRAVRRTGLVTGVICALLTGSLPFVGSGPGLVMGRATLLPSPIAFILHLLVALLYGAVFSVAIRRSRDGWTIMAAGVTAAALYSTNHALSRSFHWPALEPETTSLAAHLLFGIGFTIFFKLAEIGEEADHVTNVAVTDITVRPAAGEEAPAGYPAGLDLELG